MRHSLLAVAVGGAALVAGTVVWAPWQGGPPGEGGTGRAVAAPAPTTVPTTVPARHAAAPNPATGWIATLSAATTWSEVPGGPAAGTLPATNPFGGAEVVALVGRPRADGWAQAELPVRPDGSTGWIRTGGASLSTTGYRIAISLSARTLTLSDDGATVLTTPVGIGAARTPTPPASTYVWELVRPTVTDGAYGPYILGLAEFSDALATFNGGDAQIGIHGTDEPWTIGEAASHGCVHVPDAVITRLAATVPLGTPVVIS